MEIGTRRRERESDIMLCAFLVWSMVWLGWSATTVGLDVETVEMSHVWLDAVAGTRWSRAGAKLHSSLWVLRHPQNFENLLLETHFHHGCGLNFYTYKREAHPSNSLVAGCRTR
ncbi:hypothetical protein BDA96_04G107300 [Sorghum bicolor]|uniref:Uncharacterized protein n=2 Tax=Sorghum bicolor TaxID=4558 RepID=A0A1Z5RM82_SORBI|nr:hypothetical protein BDA96_04G107300 [Sorghum bicolor]OQU84671.1 hypothetical protein SORBI_3004G099650 [Sorghum bicolor]